MSLLTMMAQVCRRIGVTAPSAIYASTDLQIIQLVALANEEGQDLSSRYPWQALQNESTFTTSATESQGAITTLAGSDFRYVLNDIMWNRSLLVPVYGPITPQQWQQLKAQSVTGPYAQFRIRANAVRFIPTPTAGQTVAFEWISKNWVTVASPAGTSATWTADADTGLLAEEVMAAGILWRWKAAKGTEYAEDFAKYERLVVDAMARDGGKQKLSLGGGENGFPAGTFVPIGSWDL